MCEIAIKCGTSHVGSVTSRLAVVRSPRGIDCKAIKLRECRTEKRMSVRYAAIQQANRRCVRVWSADPVYQIINPHILLSPYGCREERRRVRCPPQLFHSARLCNQLLDFRSRGEHKPYLNFWKPKLLFAYCQLQSSGYCQQGFRLIPPRPKLPPDRVVCFAWDASRIRPQRLQGARLERF